ncbi:MAG TPA: hypothetical protein VG187_12265 [Mycobacterium sp.]|nr:hypothetical protein [Mycobacterium sp.]
MIVTLAAVFYSSWIRRDTWRSRWEADASLNIALQGCAVLLIGYAARVMLIVRKDPRSTATANLYLISAAFGVAATVIQVTTAEAGIDITLPVWLCACLGAIGFAYGSARSWHAKVA